MASGAREGEDRIIAEFSASIPPIQSATSIGGDGSCRLKLDIPESDIAEVLKFAAFGREKVLKVRISLASETLSSQGFVRQERR